MRILEPYSVRGDARGAFTGLVNTMAFEEINLLSTRVGVHRGGYYHKGASELFVLLEGRIVLDVDSLDGGKLFHACMLPGSVWLVEPLELHSVTAIDDCRWLNALTRRFDPADPDFHVP